METRCNKLQAYFGYRWTAKKKKKKNTNAEM